MDAQESHRAVNVFRERYETIGWAENKAAPGMVELMRCEGTGANVGRGIFQT